MYWENRQTQLMKTIGRQQQLVISEKEFNKSAFMNICPNKARDYSLTITRSTVDFVASLIAQMLSDDDIENVSEWYSKIKITIELPTK